MRTYVYSVSSRSDVGAVDVPHVANHDSDECNRVQPVVVGKVMEQGHESLYNRG